MAEEVNNTTIAVHLTREAFEALSEIARLRGLGDDIGKALEYALGNELFILEQSKDGNKILVRSKDDSLRELVVGG